MYMFIDVTTDALFHRVDATERSVDALDRLVLIMKDMLGSLIGMSKELGSFVATFTRFHLRDVRDHLSHMLYAIEMAYETVSYLNSNYLARLSIEVSQASNVMNNDMKRLSVLAALLLTMTITSSIFGMNVMVPFQNADSLGPFFGIVGTFVLLSV